MSNRLAEFDTYRIQIAGLEKERDRIETRIEELRAELNRRLSEAEKRASKQMFANVLKRFTGCK